MRSQPVNLTRPVDDTSFARVWWRVKIDLKHLARPGMRSPDLRLWLAHHGPLLGLGLALLVVTLLLAPLLYLSLPTGASTIIEGEVVALGYSETETGSYPRAVVQLADQRASVQLPRDMYCPVGSKISIDRIPRLVGYRYTARLCDAP